MGEGRFGPLFRAHDATGLAVVVRTFAQPFTDDERARLVRALTALCETPLEHPSIARPIACGVEGERPYLVHSYLQGTPIEEYIQASGHPALSDIVLRITYVAGALDFAAAAGVLHGALSARDVIFAAENAGVSGFGLVQALEAAGIPGFHAHRDDDIRALARMTMDLLGGAEDRIAPAVAAALSDDAAARPATALEFAAQLHRLLVDESAGNDVAEAALMPAAMAATANELPGVPAPPEPPELRVAAEAPRFEWDAADRDEPAPDQGHEIDIPLREEPAAPVEMLPVAPLAYVAPGLMASPTVLRGFGEAAAMPVRPKRRIAHPWLLAAAIAVAIGVFAGFAGGFFVGTREAAPPARAANATPAPATPAPETSAPAPAASAPARPEPTNGRTFTDATVDDVPAKPPAAEPPVDRPATPAAAVPQPPSDAATRGGAATARAAAAGRTADRRARETTPAVAPRTGPAAVQVISNPAGAQVFVDGRSVGYAPIVVGELSPGTHSFRMQLPGYRPWVTALTVGPGARERLAASLEQ